MTTPRPWRFEPGVDTNMGGFEGPEGENVCSFGDRETYYPTEGVPPSEDDTAFILRACNAYDELVASLRWLTESTGCADPDCCKAALEQEAARQRGRTILAALEKSS